MEITAFFWILWHGFLGFQMNPGWLDGKQSDHRRLSLILMTDTVMKDQKGCGKQERHHKSLASMKFAVWTCQNFFQITLLVFYYNFSECLLKSEAWFKFTIHNQCSKNFMDISLDRNPQLNQMPQDRNQQKHWFLKGWCESICLGFSMRLLCCHSKLI